VRDALNHAFWAGRLHGALSLALSTSPESRERARAIYLEFDKAQRDEHARIMHALNSATTTVIRKEHP
jgi:hypothetical protein